MRNAGILLRSTASASLAVLARRSYSQRLQAANAIRKTFSGTKDVTRPLAEFLRAIRYINCWPSVSAGGTGQMASPGERALAANGQTRRLGPLLHFGSSPWTWMRLEAQRRSSRAFCSISSTTRTSWAKKSKCPQMPLASWAEPEDGLLSNRIWWDRGSANLAFQMLPGVSASGARLSRLRWRWAS